MKNIWRINLFLILILLSSKVYAQDHLIFDQLLKNYVTDGFVNYRELCIDQRLPEYIDQLSATDPDDFRTKDAELAFWINAYNANTLKVICNDYPIKSMDDLNFGGLLVSVALKKTVWDRRFININGRRLSLKIIEHEIIRPKFMEPRSHLALACGAISCPPLNSSAFEGERLNEQLDEQAKKFFNASFYNSFDAEKRSARLSSLLDWNQRYFGKDERGVLEFAIAFTPYKIEDVSLWAIQYNKYDLTLNDKILQNTGK